MTGNVNKRFDAFGQYAQKIISTVVVLLDMFLRKIVQNENAHFLPVRCREFFDGTAVKFRAEPLLRIQTDTALVFLFHGITPLQDMPFSGTLQQGSPVIK